MLGDAEESAAHGITFGEPEIDIDALRGWKDSVVGKLTGGLTGLAKQRKVEVVHGDGRRSPRPHMLDVERRGRHDDDRLRALHHRRRLAAPTVLPGHARRRPAASMDSTGALELADIPERLLVIGGGIIGLEMATVYDALGSKVTVVELLDR